MLWQTVFAIAENIPYEPNKVMLDWECVNYVLLSLLVSRRLFMLSNLLTTYAVDVLEPIVKWISIPLVAAFLIFTVILFFVKNDLLKKIFKIAAFSIAVYAILLTVIMLVLDIVKHYNAAYLEKNYINKDVIYFVLLPLAITLTISLISLVTLYVLKARNSARIKLVSPIFACVFALALISSLITILIYYGKHIDGDGYYTAKGTNFNQIALYASSILLVAIEVAVVFVIDKKTPPLNAKEIARAGVCLSLAFALSYVKLYKNAAASLTLASMLPIMLFSYFYGTRKGILIGFIYGMLQCLQNPYIIHPAQFLLDYPIAFSMIGLAGILRNAKALPQAVRFGLGGAFAGIMRFLSSYLSGVFAFGAYAGEGQSVWLYSLLNTIILADALIAIIVGVLLTYNKNFRKLF